MKVKGRDIVIVVDMLEGFVNRGPLASPHVKQMVPALEVFLAKVDVPRVFVCDAHTSHAVEFTDFPPHCIIGSGEESIIKELEPYVDAVYLKNSVNAMEAPKFRAFMKDKKDTFDRVLLTGCCTDICVLNLALALKTWFNEQNLKKNVTVVLDLVETYDAPGHNRDFENQSAFSILKTNGITLCSATEIFESIEI